VSTQLQQQDRAAYLTSVARKGVWLLPAFGLLLALSTIRQQPPVQTDFAGYARFVTTAARRRSKDCCRTGSCRSPSSFPSCCWR